MKKTISLIVTSFLFSTINADDHGDGSFVIPKAEVNETLLQGLTNLAEGRTVSDIVVRHVDVGEEYLGVSVVQRSKVEPRENETGIAHVDLDEIYYLSLIHI